MADLIERDALEAKIRENSMRIRFFDPSVNVILHLIRYAPAVNRWIACSERLPEDGELVLIAHVSGSVYIADREGKYWAEDSGEWYDDENVTHWMPLPEPPEKE